MLETCTGVLEPLCGFSLWPTGHILISSYLLNYFPGLDVERRNCHGFTALMKAAVQGRAECVRAIMLAGKTWRRTTHPAARSIRDEGPQGSLLTTILFPRREYSGPGQRPQHDPQGLGSVHGAP